LGCVLIVICGDCFVLDLLLILQVSVVEEGRVILLVLHVSLWGFILLVDLHLLHLLCYFGVGLRLNGLFFHVDLGTAELFKYVLVVQNSVGEFILERCTIKEILNSGRDLRHSQDLVDRGTHCRIFLQKFSDQVRRLARKGCGKWRVLALDNLLSQLMETLSVEWWLQSCNFVQQHT